MNPICWHIILRLEGRRVFVRNVAERRLLASVVAEFLVETGVFLYHAPDNHLHVAVVCDRTEAGRIAQALAHRLRAALGLEVCFDRASIVPVETQKHLSTLPGYILGNARHHGVEVDRLLEASNLPDLLGLRVIDRVSAPRLRALVPRLRRADLLEHYGVDDLAPGTDSRHLPGAAASAMGLPNLSGRTPPAVDAKAAVVRVGLDLGVTPDRVAAMLDVTRRNVNRLAGRSVDPRLVGAVRLQIGLRERLGAPAG